jgi:hypothetical protein
MGNDVHMIQNRSRTEYVSNLHATTSQKTVANGRVLESQGTHKTNRSNLHSIEPTRKVSPIMLKDNYIDLSHDFFCMKETG